MVADFSSVFSTVFQQTYGQQYTLQLNLLILVIPLENRWKSPLESLLIPVCSIAWTLWAVPRSKSVSHIFGICCLNLNRRYVTATTRKGVAIFSAIIKSNEICINLIGELTIKKLLVLNVERQEMWPSSLRQGESSKTLLISRLSYVIHRSLTAERFRTGYFDWTCSSIREETRI